MKRFFWTGLLFGTLGSLLIVAVLWGGATAAAASQNPANSAPQAEGPGDAAILPQGGGGPGLVGTVFTYQGSLKKNGTSVNGACDLKFSLYDQQAPGGTQQGSTLTALNTPVTSGIFTASMDFGDQFNGSYRYLETQVSCPASASPVYTTLPRQLLTAAPYAMSLRPGATIAGDIPDKETLIVNNMSSANYSTALYANAQSGRAVVGYALAFSGNGVGVWGLTNSPNGVGVAAQGSGGGAALAIDGNIRVKNAGIGTSTPVFIHQVKTGTGINICTKQVFATVINNALINGRPDAILIVTPNYGTYDIGTIPAASTPAVYYDVDGDCGRGAGRWVIYSLNGAVQTDQSLFNVMAVIP
jgi:hypothetical protein